MLLIELTDMDSAPYLKSTPNTPRTGRCVGDAALEPNICACGTGDSLDSGRSVRSQPLNINNNFDKKTEKV